jgi:hypothetical protein
LGEILATKHEIDIPDYFLINLWSIKQLLPQSMNRPCHVRLRLCDAGGLVLGDVLHSSSATSYESVHVRLVFQAFLADFMDVCGDLLGGSRSVYFAGNNAKMGFDIAGTRKGSPGEGEVPKHPIDPSINIDVGSRERIEVIPIRPNTGLWAGFASRRFTFIQV